MVKVSYEQPNFKKYGTMKDLTLSKGGSSGTIGDPVFNPHNPKPDPSDVGLKDTLIGRDGTDGFPFIGAGDAARVEIDNNDDLFQD